MRTYVGITGTVFGLLALAHVWRVVEEGTHLARSPFFVLITIASAVLSAWSWRLLKS